MASWLALVSGVNATQRKISDGRLPLAPYGLPEFSLQSSLEATTKLLFG